MTEEQWEGQLRLALEDAQEARQLAREAQAIAAGCPVPKPWWKSKILWVQVSGAGLEICQLLEGSRLLPPGWITVAMAIATIAFRWVAKQPLSATQEDSR